jgi:hypothetical protein
MYKASKNQRAAGGKRRECLGEAKRCKKVRDLTSDDTDGPTNMNVHFISAEL